MITPDVSYHNSHDNGEFTIRVPNGYKHNNLDFAVPSLGIVDNDEWSKKGYLAVLRNEGWTVSEAILSQSYAQFFSASCSDGIHTIAMAYPIDPAMTRQDIEGATKIYRNSTNTGWLFAHAEDAHHHDRIFTLESIMTTAFQDVLDGKMQQTLAIVTKPPSTARPVIGDPGSGNAKAYYLQWNTIVEFRKECVKWVREYEKILHIGQHIQEDDLYVHDQLTRAIAQAKKVWTRDKADDLSSISAELAIVEGKINTLHTFETRWAKAARVTAEAKKAAAANSNSG